MLVTTTSIPAEELSQLAHLVVAGNDAAHTLDQLTDGDGRRGQLNIIVDAGRDAREQIALGNLGLVHTVVHRSGHPRRLHEDLVQAGIIGLLQAIARFDPDRGVRFSTYAWPWITKYVNEAAAREHLVTIPREAIADPGNRGDVARAMLYALNNRICTEDLEALGYDTPGTVNDFDAVEFRVLIDECLAVVPKRQRDVLLTRFGVGQPEGDFVEIATVAERCGVSIDRARSLINDAMGRLLHPLNRRRMRN